MNFGAPTATNYSFHLERRHTRLQLGIGEKTLLYGGHLFQRSAKDMRPYAPRTLGVIGGIDVMDAPQGRGVMWVPGNALVLTPFMNALVNVTRLDWADAVITQASGAIGAALRVVEIPMHRRPDDLPGIGASADTVSAGIPAQIKRMPAGTNWSDAQLASDLAALPPPDDPDLTIPVDRIISGRLNYPANSGFGLVFTSDADFWSVGTFLRLYFGGPTPTSPFGTYGGMFCLAFRGSGYVHLYEYDGNRPGPDPWRLRRSLRWKGSDRPSYSQEHFWVMPLAWDRLVLGGSVQEPLLPQLLGPLGYLFPHQGFSFLSAYHADEISEGHHHIEAMTGPGIIRVDVRRTARAPFSLLRLKYPSQGLWVDYPFDFRRPYPAGTKIFVNAQVFRLPGTSIQVQLYDADTDAPLAVDPLTGAFLSNANQARYYAAFLFNTTDRYSTPALFQYSLQVNAIFQDVVRTREIAKIHTHISITGEDEEGSDHVGGTVQIVDLTGARVVAQRQDRQRSLLSVFDDTDTLISHLGEYEVVKSKAKLRGAPPHLAFGSPPGSAGSAYPSQDWRDYTDHLVGLWVRLQEARASQLYNFGWDQGITGDPITQNTFPWKVVDAVRVLLNDAGFPNDEIDLPANALRFWVPAGGNTGDQYLLQPGQPILPVLEHLIGMYLRGVLIRDPNAGPRGCWRVIVKPARPWSNFLWTFRKTRTSGAAGKYQMAAGAYGAATSPILKGTYDQWPEAPVANVVVVRGVGRTSQGTFKLITPLVHQDSIDNPASIHYLARELPYIRPVDAAIQDQNHCDFVAARLFEEMAFWRLHATFQAPAPFVNDPQDLLQQRPRPLRVYDKVMVEDDPFILTNMDLDVHPGRGSENHIGTFEGYFE